MSGQDIALRTQNVARLPTPTRVANIGRDALRLAGKKASLQGRRVGVLHPEPGAADALAETLRMRGAQVAVLSLDPTQLARAEALDPEVIVVDPRDFAGACWSTLAALIKHPQLRWTSVLFSAPETMEGAGFEAHDIPGLCAQVQLLCADYDAAVARAKKSSTFEVSLEVLGPARALRLLVQSGQSWRVRFTTRTLKVEVDTSEGLIVGARGGHAGESSESLLGTPALNVLLREANGTVDAEVVARPAVTNIMSPLDAALAAAFHGREVREPPRPQSAESLLVPSSTPSGVRSVSPRTLLGMPPVAARPSMPAEQRPLEQRSMPKPTLGKDAVLALQAIAPPPDNDQGLFGNVTPSTPPQHRPASLPSAEVLAEEVGLSPASPTEGSNALTAVARASLAAAPTMASMPAASARASLPTAPARASLPAAPTKAALPTASARASLPTAPTKAALPTASARASLASAPTAASLGTAATIMSLPTAPTLGSLPAAAQSAPARESLATAPTMASLATDPTMESLPPTPVRSSVATAAPRTSVAAAAQGSSELSRAFDSEPAARASAPRARQLLRYAKPLAGAAVATLVAFGLLALSGAPDPAAPQSAKPAAAAVSVPQTGAAVLPAPVVTPLAIVTPLAVAQANSPKDESADVASDEPALTDSAAARTARANAHVLRGNQLLRRGLTAKAKSRYQAALQWVPSQTRALMALTRLTLKERNATAALSYARTFARVRPKSKTALLMLGDAQRLSGDLTSARTSWQRAAQRGSKDAKQRLRDTAK